MLHSVKAKWQMLSDIRRCCFWQLWRCSLLKVLQLDIWALSEASCKVKLHSKCCWNDGEIKTLLWQSSRLLRSPLGRVLWSLQVTVLWGLAWHESPFCCWKAEQRCIRSSGRAGGELKLKQRKTVFLQSELYEATSRPLHTWLTLKHTSTYSTSRLVGFLQWFKPGD